MKQFLTKLQKFQVPIFMIAAFGLACWYVVTLLQFFPITVLPLQNSENLVKFLDPAELLIVLLSILVGSIFAYLIPRIVPKLPIKKMLLFIFFVSLPFVFLYPGDAADFFTNLWYAERVLTLHENPYTATFPPYGFQNYHPELPMVPPSPLLPYGPLWLGWQVAIYSIIQTLPIVWMVIAFKLIQLGGWLLTAAILLKLTQTLAAEKTSLMFSFLISPLALWASVGHAHNDVWLVLLLAMSVWLLKQKKFFWALTLLLVSVYIKYVSVFLVPFYWLYWYRNSPREDMLRKSLIWLALAVASLIFFESQFHFLNGLLNQGALTGFTLFFALNRFQPSFTLLLVKKGLFVIFGLGYLVVVWWLAHKKTVTLTDVLRTITFVFSLIFLFVTQLWGYWYLLWIAPFMFTFPKKVWLQFFCLSTINMSCMVLLWYAFRSVYEGTVHFDLFVIRCLLFMGIITVTHVLFIYLAGKNLITHET